MKKKPMDEFEADWMKDIEDDQTERDNKTERRLKGRMIVDQSLKKVILSVFGYRMPTWKPSN